jgi:SAM-dependent methyltransferase
MEPDTRPAGLQGISEELRAFVEEFPWERRPILDFVQRSAASLSPGSRLLDIGSGDAPYRELFDHVEYVSHDWENSIHPGAREADLIGSADSLPVEAEAFHAVLLTQVLEHVSEPAAVLAEVRRVLMPGGTLFMTAPLTWELHEMPYDFYRYTSEGLRHLLDGAGFVDIEVNARNDCFTTLAQLMRNAAAAMGRAADGLDTERDRASDALWRLADQTAELAPLDAAWTLPLGYSATAVRARLAGGP